MKDEQLTKRGRALEEAFFNKYNDQLLEKLRAKEEASKKKQALADATGIRDERVLDELLDAGVEASTLAALAIAPLVLLAWRDGKIETRERGAILRAADEQGLGHQSVAYQLIEKWLNERPGDTLTAAWKGYVEALRQNLAPEAYAALRDDILTRTRKVARAAGGYLGFARVSAQEKELLQRLEEILR